VASPSASASPAKFNLGDLFKPRTSTAAASPAAAGPAAAKGTSTQAATKAPAPGGGHGKVWVNTETHVYHKEGSRFYGTTKKGKYMTEAEAIKEGNKAGASGIKQTESLLSAAIFCSASAKVSKVAIFTFAP